MWWFYNTGDTLYSVFDTIQTSPMEAIFFYQAVYTVRTPNEEVVVASYLTSTLAQC